MASGIQSRGSLGLQGLRDRIASLAGGGFRTRVAQLCAAAAGKMVNDGFRGGVDPYGAPWAPLQSRKGKSLLLTGRLRASFATGPTTDGFRIGSNVAYAGYQQYGTKPHARASRVARQNSRGRFVKKTARTAYLVRIRGHVNGGIPARPMLPTESGGMPPLWTAAFRRIVEQETSRQIRGAA